MSKLSWHFQKRPSQVVDIVNGSACQWVKMIDPPEGSNPFPNKKVVGRIWIGGDGIEGKYVRLGAMGATAYLEHRKDNVRLLDYMLRRPYVTAWEGPNEPHPLSKIWFRKALAEFESQRCDIMHLNGLPLAVWGFSVGWLHDPRHILRFRESAQNADYAHLHEYSAPRMRAAEGWHCLRYRSSYQWLKNQGIRQPELLLTESGIDGGAHHIESEKRGGKGWKSYVSEDEYMADLAWYDSELCKDKYVKAAFVFTAGPESSWRDFEVTESLSRKIAMHTHAHPHEEEPPMEPNPTELAEVVRQHAMRAWGMSVNRTAMHVAYTPHHGLYREARARKLGMATTPEFPILHDRKSYVCQGFALGINYTVKDHWGPDDIMTVEW